MLKSLGKTLRGKLEQNIIYKNTFREKWLHIEKKCTWSCTFENEVSQVHIKQNSENIATNSNFSHTFLSRNTNHFLHILTLNVLFTHLLKLQDYKKQKPQLPLPPLTALRVYNKICEWGGCSVIELTFLSGSQIHAASDRWAHRGLF